MGLVIEPHHNPQAAADRKALHRECAKWAKFWLKRLLIPEYWNIYIEILPGVQEGEAWSMETHSNPSYNHAIIRVQPNVELDDVPWMLLHEMLHVVQCRWEATEEQRTEMESVTSHLTSVIWSMYKSGNKATEKATKKE